MVVVAAIVVVVTPRDTGDNNIDVCWISCTLLRDEAMGTLSRWGGWANRSPTHNAWIGVGTAGTLITIRFSEFVISGNRISVGGNVLRSQHPYSGLNIHNPSQYGGANYPPKTPE